MRVSLPIYLIRLLEHLAREESHAHDVPRNASDVIERLLHEDANAQDHHIEAAIPGFMQALDYPYYTPPVDATWHRCRYCDITIAEPSRAVCRSCKRRHEPKEHLGEYGLEE